jgi:hypothetical protein
MRNSKNIAEIHFRRGFVCRMCAGSSPFVEFYLKKQFSGLLLEVGPVKDRHHTLRSCLCEGIDDVRHSFFADWSNAGLAGRERDKARIEVQIPDVSNLEQTVVRGGNSNSRSNPSFNCYAART